MRLKASKLLWITAALGSLLFLVYHKSLHISLPICSRHPVNTLLEDLSAPLNCNLISSNCSEINWEFYTEHATISRLENCSNYFQKFPSTAFFKASEGNDLKLSFAIMAHNELPLLEVLLASIFRPYHSYCFFVDAKSDNWYFESVVKLINCYKLHFPKTDIFLIEDRHEVFWGHFSMLEADLKCLNRLLEIPNWNFFINQAATAMPLMKIGQIEEKLRHFGLFQDSIQSEFTRPGMQHRYQYIHQLMRPPHYFENVPGLYDLINVPTSQMNSPPPYNLTIFKGYKENVISRGTALFLTKTELAQTFLNWLKATGCPEEFYYATLARVSQHNYLTENGRIIQDLNPYFDGTNGICPRFSWWISSVADQRLCQGGVKRFMCIVSLADLPKVYENGGGNCFFVNKLQLKSSVDALQCLHEFHTVS